MDKGNLYINGQFIEKWESELGLDDEDDTVSYNIPDYILVDRKNADKVILDLDESDIETLSHIFRFDTDKYINKKVRVILQVLGNKDRQR